MTADDVTRLLVELILRLPPELRPGVGGALTGVAATQPYWTPLVVGLLAVVAIGSIRLYVEGAS